MQIIYDLTENKDVLTNPDIDLLDNVLDSFDFANLVIELEEKYDIEIELSQIKSSTWRKIDSIVEMVKGYVGEKII